MIHEVKDKNINSTKKKKFENQSLNAFFKNKYISCQKITRLVRPQVTIPLYHMQ